MGNRMVLTKISTRRTLSVELDQETVEGIVKEWAQKNLASAAEFSDLSVDIGSVHWEGSRFSCVVTGTSVEESEGPGAVDCVDRMSGSAPCVSGAAGR